MYVYAVVLACLLILPSKWTAIVSYPYSHWQYVRLRHSVVCTDVYERLTPKGKPPTFFTLIVTQLVSGIWHGLFPGYVLFFISSALMFQSSKVLYRYERNWPKQVQKFPLWTLAKWAYTAFCLNYCASAFMVSPHTLTVPTEVTKHGSKFVLDRYCRHSLCALLAATHEDVGLSCSAQTCGMVHSHV